MCHDTNGSNVIEIQINLIELLSKPHRNYDTLLIPNEVLIGNRWFDYTTFHDNERQEPTASYK
jgi:hypothetical protein